MAELKIYCVVFFESYVQTVPISWINKEEKVVYYPPNLFNKKNIDSLIVSDGWEKYPIKKILEPFTYDEAIAIEKKCVEANSSDSTDAIIKNVLEFSERKRKRKAPTKFDETDEEESIKTISADRVKKHSFLESPPTSFISKANELSVHEDENSINESGEVPYEDEEISLNHTDEKSQKEMQLTPTTETKEAQLKPFIKSVAEVSIPMSVLKPKNMDTKSCCKCGSMLCSCKCHDEPLTERKFKMYYNYLIKKINKSNRQTEAENEPDMSLLPRFPLKNKIEFQELNNLLCKEEPAAQFYEMIKKIGGADQGQHARAALQRIMTYSLGAVYSWSGQRSTLKFKNTRISDILIDAVSNSRSDYKRLDCENIIKKWLQHANEKKLQ